MHGNQNGAGHVYLFSNSSKTTSLVSRLHHQINWEPVISQYFLMWGSDLTLASSFLSCEQIHANKKSRKSCWDFSFIWAYCLFGIISWEDSICTDPWYAKADYKHMLEICGIDENLSLQGSESSCILSSCGSAHTGLDFEEYCSIQWLCSTITWQWNPVSYQTLREKTELPS